MSEDKLPGGDGSILEAGAAERIAERVIDRKALFQPKDEELPPPGVNWYDHNWSRAMPSSLGIKVNVDIREMAKHIEPFVLAGDVGSIIQSWQNAGITVSFDKTGPLVNVKVVPS